MRKLCASAMRSIFAPKRSPRIAISAAPPGTLAKKAVVLSVPVKRARMRPPIQPSAVASTAAAISTCHCDNTWSATCGVKYRPNAMPMTTCPVSRPKRGATRCTPRNFPSAIANSGPIIHGSGVFSQAHTAPPTIQAASAVSGAIVSRLKLFRLDAGLLHEFAPAFDFGLDGYPELLRLATRGRYTVGGEQV